MLLTLRRMWKKLSGRAQSGRRPRPIAYTRTDTARRRRRVAGSDVRLTFRALVRARLGLQSPATPLAPGSALEHEPLVTPVGAKGQELQAGRDHSIAAPAIGAGDRFPIESLPDGKQARLELLLIVERVTLPRRP